MILLIRKYLILILALLQLFAPLVHAHTGHKSFTQGLHIPGLELYRTSQDTQVLQAVNSDTNTEGLLILVDAGIKSPQDVMTVIVNNHYALLPANQLQINVLPKTDSNFSPQYRSFHLRELLSISAPRAPPARLS